MPSTVDLYSLAEEVIEKAEEAAREEYGRFDTRWGKWSRNFNLGLQAASTVEPKTSSIFTLWVLVSQCVENSFHGNQCSRDTIAAMKQMLIDVGAPALSTRIEGLYG